MAIIVVGERMKSIVHCFSVLVASGNGHRCNDLKKILRQELHKVDPETNQYKLGIWKYGSKTTPKAYKRISLDVARALEHLFVDVSDHFISVDNPARERFSNDSELHQRRQN